jgi:hypothetical protein
MNQETTTEQRLAADGTYQQGYDAAMSIAQKQNVQLSETNWCKENEVMV